ncbi:hypothetical protein [uncultured Lactobacillus sp.]|uniref:hypothetical protein n=1 Tax=uncultured Lactobacillus sp. TaxID=153152 RepID=UPI0025ED1E3D|nr:hypothetical protein [uncultured Lactobacillus sp.]
MRQKQTFLDKVFQFDQELGNVKIDLPAPYKLVNPYSSRNKKPFKTILSELVFERFYFVNMITWIKKVYA